MRRLISGLWLVFGILLLTIVTQHDSRAAEQKYFNNYNTAPADTTFAELKSKYESELKKLKAAFEQIYLQIAHNDPQVNQRMQQLLEGNSKAVSLITTIQIYEKLVKELTEEKTNTKEVINKQRGKK